MNAIETLAIGKAVKDEAQTVASKEVAAGKYEGAFLARISYALKKGEDYEQRITAKAKPWQLLAVALSKLNGVTVDMLVREAASGEIETEEIENRAAEAMEAVKGATITKCGGKITGSVEVEIVPTMEATVTPA